MLTVCRNIRGIDESRVYDRMLGCALIVTAGVMFISLCAGTNLSLAMCIRLAFRSIVPRGEQLRLGWCSWNVMVDRNCILSGWRGQLTICIPASDLDLPFAVFSCAFSCCVWSQNTPSPFRTNVGLYDFRDLSPTTQTLHRATTHSDPYAPTSPPRLSSPSPSPRAHTPKPPHAPPCPA